MCELPRRELQFLIILKSKLEHFGHEVKLIPQRLPLIIKLLKFKPDIIVVNGLRSYSSYVNQIYIPKKLLKSQVVSLYSEQVGRLGGLADSYDNNYILQSVDKHIVWGKKFAQGLQYMGVKSNDIFITGSMGLDLIQKHKSVRENNRTKTSERFNLSIDKKWVLIADNIIRKGDQKESYETLRDNFDKKLSKIMSRFPDCEFVFRPHPDNNENDLALIRSHLGQFSNFHIIAEEHSTYWIVLMDAVIVWRSTSSIEAWSANIPTFGLKTDVNDWDYWWEGLMAGYVDENELIEVLEDTLLGTKSYRATKECKTYMNNWFHRIDGLAIDRVASVVDSLGTNKGKTPQKNITFVSAVSHLFLEYVNWMSKSIGGNKRVFEIPKNDINSSLYKIENYSERVLFEYNKTADGIRVD